MRIGIFSDSINIPPKEGINVHTYELARSLALKQQAVFLFVCDRGWLDLEALRNEPFTTVLLPEKLFYDAAYISTHLQLFAIDIAQTYMTYFGATVLGPACQSSGCTMIAEFHDLEEDVVPLYFTKDELNQATRNHRNFQYDEAHYADMVRVMSYHDYLVLRSRWKNTAISQKLIWLPVGINVGNGLEQPRQSARSHIVYVGNMSYTPNAEGAAILRDTIAPHIPTLHLRFIGRGSEHYTSENIEALGMVPDLAPYLSDAALGVSPIIRGSGMKIKNLTYLSAGLPVITTSIGARGYPESEAIIIEDDFAVWPQVIRELLDDTERLSRLSQEALRYCKKHFDADRINNQLLKHYEHLLSLPKKRVKLQQPVIDMRHVYWLREVREHGRQPVKSLTVIKGSHDTGA